MYLDVALSLVCLPWILAYMVSGQSYDHQLAAGGGLPWPRRSLPVLLAFPLLSIGWLCVMISTMDLVVINIYLYVVPLVVVHLVAALLQTVSLLVAGSLLTASIRDMSAHSVFQKRSFGSFIS
jgi:hypothetical protein